MVTQKLILFETSLRKANQILKVIGLEIDSSETNQSFLERVANRKLFCFLSVQLYLELSGEIAWFYDKGITNGNFLEATYSLPCAAICLLGIIKTYYRIKYGHLINELIQSLQNLHAVDAESMSTKSIAYKSILKIVKNLDMSVKAIIIFSVCGLIMFIIGPLIIISYIYFTTGEVILFFGFPIYYPFYALNFKVYPFVYLHQVIGATFALLTLCGPDCLYYTFCTFVQVEFCSMQYEMETIITHNCNLKIKAVRDAHQKKFVACVSRHSEVIRCVALIEVIYSKSTLFNFLSSSLLLCLAGFNVIAYESLAMMGNFVSFLLLCLVQIYLLCYYGDNVSRTSVEVSNAVYNSQWYNVDGKIAKDLLMVLTRAQKPCKLTAYTFADTNLTAFTRVLSSSWSYFALLQSVYDRK